MSKKTSYLLSILATILIGTFLYNKVCCQECCAESQENNIPVVTDNIGMGDYNIFNLSGNEMNYTCNDNFRFLTNGYNNILPVSDSINKGIGLLKKYPTEFAKRHC